MFSSLNRLTRVLRRRTELCYNQQRSSGFIVLWVFCHFSHIPLIRSRINSVHHLQRSLTKDSLGVSNSTSSIRFRCVSVSINFVFWNSRLPEIDPDVADKLLSVCDDLPKFSQLSTDKIFTLMGKGIMDYECVVRNTDRKLQGWCDFISFNRLRICWNWTNFPSDLLVLTDSPKLYPDLFEDVLDPMEKATATFDTVLGTMKTLYLGNSESVPPNIYYALATRAMNARNTKYVLDDVYDRCKVNDFLILSSSFYHFLDSPIKFCAFIFKNCDKSKLTEEQSRLVDKHVIEGRLNAIDAKPRFRSIHSYKTARLSQRMSQFRIRVEVIT